MEDNGIAQAPSWCPSCKELRTALAESERKRREAEFNSGEQTMSLIIITNKLREAEAGLAEFTVMQQALRESESSLAAAEARVAELEKAIGTALVYEDYAQYDKAFGLLAKAKETPRSDLIRKVLEAAEEWADSLTYAPEFRADENLYEAVQQLKEGQ